ncbi:MAG: formate dehydrogenase accessory sulfurtransferase FdhD [Candidatus Symbiobacter sp.]|nr:formate dehydrogenase accessory sulfurtransferase FdhD [Candidatus Symbiobacter sp.]
MPDVDQTRSDFLPKDLTRDLTRDLTVAAEAHRRVTAKEIVFAGKSGDADFVVAEEVPVALVYNGMSHVVLMATPQDLSDLAVGFSLSEGIIDDSSEIMRIAVVQSPLGIEVTMDILGRRLHELQERRRHMVGATGCGLCGIESLAQLAMGGTKRDVAPGKEVRVAAVRAAFAALGEQQILNQQSHSLHAAAFADFSGAVQWVREDVGRHNALDKLIGAMADANRDFANGFVVMTSRCSYELVRKAARVGVGALATISAPTGRALDEASAAGMGLIALARHDGLKIFCHAERFTV